MTNYLTRQLSTAQRREMRRTRIRAALYACAIIGMGAASCALAMIASGVWAR